MSDIPPVLSAGGFFVTAYWKLINRVIFVAGIAGVFYPAFSQGPNDEPPPSITQALISIFIHPIFDLGWFSRCLCLFLILGTSYIYLVEKIYRNTPITVVKTDIEFSFHENYTKAISKRTQRLRANQNNVTAYFSSAKPTAATGEVLPESIKLSVYCPDLGIQTRNIEFLESGRGYDIIHEFNKALPFEIWMPLIFRFMLTGEQRSLFSIIRNKLVILTQTATYVNEFNVEKPRIRLRAANYPQHNISITLKFIDAIPDTLKVFRLKNNSLIAVDFQKTNDQDVHIFLDRLQEEILEIKWLPHSII